MVIRFLCPGGHKVHCPDEQAGRAAKCPQCAVRFYVPSAGVPEDTWAERIEVAGAASAGPPDLPADSAAKFNAVRSGPAAVKPKEPQIEFLCPNGHPLHGPASLQGRPGQCPECGSKFRIPTYDDTPEGDSDNADANQPAYDAPDGYSVSEQNVYQDGGSIGVNGYAADGTVEQSPVSDEMAGPAAVDTGTAAAWQSIFDTLWPLRSDGAVLEIVLKSGEKIVPDFFSRSFLQQGCGLFVVENANGTYTMKAVAWSSVAQVLLRGIKALPSELF